jgi:hypothetical protein
VLVYDPDVCRHDAMIISGKISLSHKDPRFLKVKIWSIIKRNTKSVIFYRVLNSK